MDVKCERCNTEYEFDDALVSGRGTTVKCTNCGHKFKIRRSDGDFSEDFWNVTTGDGRTLVFTSLRELQRAIQGYLVERNDRLSRGGLPPKAIGQIPELAPFFDQREAAKKNPSGKPTKTQDGLGPAAERAAKEAVAAPVGALPPPRPRQPTKPEFPAPPASEPSLVGGAPLRGSADVQAKAPSDPSLKSTRIGTCDLPSAPIAAAVPNTAPLNQTAPMAQPAVSAAPAAVKREATHTAPMMRPSGVTPPPPPPVVPPPAPAAMTRTAVMSNPPPLPPRRSGAPSGSGVAAAPARTSVSLPPALPDRGRGRTASLSPGADPSSSDRMLAIQPLDASSPLPPEPRMRSLLSEIEEDRDARSPYDAEEPPRRRSVGGFIVATVVVGCLLLLGAVWAQKNLGVTLGTKPPAPAPTIDPRVGGFLSSGEKALSDGNVELAKENFDKASALAEKDAHVLLDVARLAAVRADVLWLKSRLLPADATDEHRITRDGLVELAAGARKAADEALAVGPDDPAALRAKIDALRISGDRDGARALVAKISQSAAQPESAYVLAALDLAEVEPLWPGLLDRLRTAANVETGPGRARAALVYALGRSGDGADAKAEVERLANMTKPHPLLPLLRAFAERAKTQPKADAGVAEALDGRVDAGRVGVGVTPNPIVAGNPAVPPPAGNPTPAPAALPADVRDLVSQGEKARVRGDYERARTLFNAAVDKNPNDSEAIAGLAAISYAKGDMAGARASYKRVLSINPNYMPALVGLADVEWDSGDKGSAAKMYKDIVDRYPEGAYPARAKQRSEGGG